VPYLSALEVRSRQSAIQIHVYLYLTLPCVLHHKQKFHYVATYTNKWPSTPHCRQYHSAANVYWVSVMTLTSDLKNLLAKATHITTIYAKFRWNRSTRLTYGDNALRMKCYRTTEWTDGQCSARTAEQTDNQTTWASCYLSLAAKTKNRLQTVNKGTHQMGSAGEWRGRRGRGVLCAVMSSNWETTRN